MWPFCRKHWESCGNLTRTPTHDDLLPLRQSAYHAHHSTEMAITNVHNRLVRNVDRGGHVSALVLLDLSSAFDVEHAILLDVLEKPFGIGGMVLKLYHFPQWSNADLPSGITELTNLCRLLQHATKLRPRSTEAHGLYRGSTSHDERYAIEHHLCAVDTVAFSILNMVNFIDPAHTYLVFFEASSTESNEVQDYLVRDPCQSETFTAHRLQSTCRHSHNQAYQCHTRSLVCCSTANWLCGNTSANSRDCVIISTWAALATNPVPHRVQVVPDNAHRSNRMQPWLRKEDSNADDRAA